MANSQIALLDDLAPWSVLVLSVALLGFQRNEEEPTRAGVVEEPTRAGRGVALRAGRETNARTPSRVVEHPGSRSAPSYILDFIAGSRHARKRLHFVLCI